MEICVFPALGRASLERLRCCAPRLIRTKPAQHTRPGLPRQPSCLTPSKCHLGGESKFGSLISNVIRKQWELVPPRLCSTHIGVAPTWSVSSGSHVRRRCWSCGCHPHLSPPQVCMTTRSPQDCDLSHGLWFCIRGNFQVIP